MNNFSISLRFVACTLTVALWLPAVGCTKSDPPRFRFNLQGKDPADFRAKSGEVNEKLTGLDAISTALYAMFGTPDDPYVMPETGLDEKKIRLASGRVSVSDTGKHAGLYREHCAHCHGITGDGAGPTALFLNPYPRDYRQGVFKFKSTERVAKPTREDLHRVLIEGVPGTAMPSFALLPADEVDALVEYVKYLSIRGETETLLSLQWIDAGEKPDLSRAALVNDFLTSVVEMWASAPNELITPPPAPPAGTPEALAASIETGRKLFMGDAGQCAKCHGPSALGDTDDPVYDVWNEGKQLDHISWWLLPKQEAPPRNLRLGNYRGGRRPIDIYRRIHAGINGSPMPAMAKTPSNPSGAFTPEEIWHLVRYVRSLPYESASEPTLFERTLVNAPN